ncbi:MAG: DUF2075 domain-containing protein [Verrucomicrobia bacterium]|nr:DUF2075 domain-containing protein [Verrucomicrobiota bacterium]
MALFIRKRPPERCHSTEVEVAEFLAELDDDWLIRWGFTYRDNRGSPREGDFLIAGPRGGVLVLEVKSGTVSLNPYTGRWNTPDGDDPQFQLDEEWSDVLRSLDQQRGTRPSVFVGRALGTPHLSLPRGSVNHHGIPREFILDRGDLRRFAAAWDERMRDWGAVHGRSDREVFEEAFCRDATPRAIRHFVDDVDRTLMRHTESGYTLLDQLGANRRFLVSGGAGTGKTWLALELVRRWSTEPGRKVLLLGYNLGFTAELRSLVERMATQNRIRAGSVVVRAWEELVQEKITEAGLPYEPPDESEARRRFFEEQIPGLLADLLVGEHVAPRFDALVVDEAQDHDTEGSGGTHPGTSGSWWPVYFRLLRNGSDAPVAVFHDEAQRPAFRAGRFEVPSLLRTWGVEPVRIHLVQSLRYTRQIHGYLRGLESEPLRPLVAGLGNAPSWTHGIEVEQIEATGADTRDRVAEVVERWVGQGWARPEQILILSRRGSLARSALAGVTGLAGHPLVEDFHPPRGSLGFGSVNRAKGLDRLAVIVIDFPPWASMPQSEHVPFFLGVSRARQLLAVVGSAADSVGDGSGAES